MGFWARFCSTIAGGGEPYYEDYYTSDNTIDRYWAHNLNLLSTVILPANLETIGNYAFEGNRLLLNITIPGSVTSIGEGAFKDCENLTGLLVIPDSVTSIGSQAFLRCSSLTGLVIGESVEFIGSLAFGDCKNLTGTLIIPNSVTEIGKSAFINCNELTELYLGESVHSIGVHAFTSDSPNGSKLTTLYYNAINCALPDTHNSYTLVFSRTIKTVIIGDKVEAIPPYAFSLTQIPEIIIPNSVISIGVNAFENCNNLTTATIGESVTHISVGAFSNNYLNSKLTTLYFNAINCETTKFPRTIKNLYIGDNVSQIPDNAFQDCNVLTEVYIPNSVTSIGENAFENCDSLSVLTISNSVTSIGKEAFRHCLALTELIIPESVTFIGEEAFRDCYNLSTLYFNATNCEPPQSSFWHSSPFPLQLETIIIGDGITKIPDGMFNYCSGVRNIIISKTVKSIGKDAFLYTNPTYVRCEAVNPPECGGLGFTNNVSERTLYVRKQSLDKYKYTWPWGGFAPYFAQILPYDDSEEPETPGEDFGDGNEPDDSDSDNPDKPGEGDDDAAIDGVYGDSEGGVSVEGGRIVAPEGSVVYDMTGKRVAVTNLPAGIYIVRTPAGLTVKVRL